MATPSSTYRIQLHKDFTFRELQRILDYLHTLGINTVYASPITQATPGSMHGYDVTDPHVINPELGTVDDLRSIIRELRKKDMYWLQDVVPNHMAFHPMNFRLMDVLERGDQSPYYRYFDIDWNHWHQDLKGKVMVPFLGDELQTCIAEGHIKLSFSDEGISVKCYDTAYPLSLSAYPPITSLLKLQGKDDWTLAILSKMIAGATGADYQTWQTVKKESIASIAQEPSEVQKLESLLKTINEDKDRLRQVLDQQYYRLSFWKETDDRINYRRFFTVNELICLRMEDENVFDEYHRYLLKLYREKLVDGFRIDHIDGLQDPARYTRQLRDEVSDATYVIAEKILEAREEMPTQWSLQGTSGYEFLSFLNRLLTHRKGARELLSFYQKLVPDMPPYRKLIFGSKKLILENYMKGEWDNLVHFLDSLGLTGAFEHGRVKQALGFFMLSLPVYRIYPARLPLRGKSLLTLHEAFERALQHGPEYKKELNYLRDLFTTPPVEEDHDRILHFLKRLMQFTGPLTAKGVEDTTFYIYNPLISHDEVGDSPAPMGMTIQSFHDKMMVRQAATPLSLNASATHDTKRGEDARVRINVLSRIPSLWQEHVRQWLDINRTFRTTINGRTVPQLNDEYFIYQSMLGGFPEDFKVTDDWIKRVHAYLNKALREAKVNTNWSEPDEAYEKACEKFVENILGESHRFLQSFIPFVKTVSEHAVVYALTQTLIKLTAPGIPDVYQGCELWDLSFVDPDNRRPVDFEKRMEFLFQLVIKEEKGKDAVFEYLREHRHEGIEKLYIIWKTLNFRRRQPDLFTAGEYIPIEISGGEVSAAGYARMKDDSWVVVLFPFGSVTHDTIADLDSGSRQYAVLPENAPEVWTEIFSGRIMNIQNQISLYDAFNDFPVALLVSGKC